MSTATMPGQLALFRVPNVRRDRRFRLAVLYREVCLHDNPVDGCYAFNRYFADKFLHCHPATVRGMVTELEACQLVERTIEHGTERTLRPLVPLQDLFTLWPELAQVCASCRRLGGALRAAARAALQRARGVMARYTPKSHERSQGASQSPSSAQEVRAFSDGKYAGSSLLQSNSAKRETTTDKHAHEKPTEEVTAAVSSLREVVSEAEALELAREAAKLEKSPEQVKQAVQALQAQAAKVFNRGGWLREALRRGFNPSAPSHPSDMKPGFEPIKPTRVSDASLNRSRNTPAPSQTSEDTTQGREYFQKTREALTQGEATEAPRSLPSDPGKTSASGSGTARPVVTPAPSQSSPVASVGDDAAFMSSLTSEQLAQAKEHYLARFRVPALRKGAAESLEKHGLSSVGMIAAARELFS